MIDELFERFDGAYAENTIRAYRSDFNDYAGWCDKQGLAAVPPNGAHLADYVTDMAERRSIATIQRRLASLSSLFRLLELNDPTKGADCQLAFKRARRRYGAPPKQATPLTRELLEPLLATCDNSVVGRRDRIMLRLGYHSLRRRSELVAFQFDDLIQTPAGTTRLHLRRSKTDQFAQGKQLALPRDLVDQLYDWRQTVNGRSDFIVCTLVNQQPANRPLEPARVNQILRQRQAMAGIELAKPLSGHSFRVGGALDLLRQGMPLEKIMLKGGWKSESTALRYLREWVDEE